MLYKMKQKVLSWSDQYINKNAFHKSKKPISIAKVETKTILLYEMDSYGKKGSFIYFIEYINKTDPFPVSLGIKLPQMNGLFYSNNK